MRSKSFFTVIIPVHGKFVKRSFPGCEVIYIKEHSKSEARNLGAKMARGKYLIHIDKDNIVPKKILIEARKLILQKKAKAIVLEEYIKNPKNIWQKARKKEREILAGNKTLSTPQIIEKKLFIKSGGYDERFNELDDWALYMRLKKIPHTTYHIKHATAIYEPVNLFRILQRRFKKGTELQYFFEVYGNVPQTSLKNLITSYKKTLPTLALLILKFFDYTGLIAGSIFPKRPKIELMYQEQNVALAFDSKNKNIYERFKDVLEKKAVLMLLGKKSHVLDLGCGTGRLTKVLIKNKFSVLAADISSEMLKVYRKNKLLPKPVLLERDSKLPFKSRQFDAVVSMRVIWHINDSAQRDKFFKEAVRVVKKSIIMDFPLIASPADHRFSLREISQISKKNKLKITGLIPLPLGRILVRFDK